MASKGIVNVLMVTTAFQSHMNPMLRFAKRLIPKGVHVTLITTELARDRMLRYNNNNNNNTNEESQIKFEFFSDGLSIDFDRNKHQDTFAKSLETIGSKNLFDLIDNLIKTKGNNYSCMIFDYLLPWAIDLATPYGIPCAMIWLQPCSILSINHHFHKNRDLFDNFIDPNEKVQFPALPLLEVRDLPSYLLPHFPSFGKQFIKDVCEASTKVKWVFLISNLELEEEIIKFMASSSNIPIHPIGPLVPQSMLGEKETNNVHMNMWSVENSSLNWLDEKPNSSIIYISFGSLMVLSQDQVDNIAMALKNSNKGFLWVIKPAEKDSEDEIPKLPLGFLEETKGRGLVVSWCEQEKVLMHHAIGCFMTHCGWNSMLETIVAGVPIIAYPKWLDQPTNARIIVKEFHNGVVMSYGEDGVASVEEIEKSIKEVMDGPSAEEIKKKALELKEIARKALEEGGSSYNNLNQFVNEIKKNNVGNVA